MADTRARRAAASMMRGVDLRGAARASVRAPGSRERAAGAAEARGRGAPPRRAGATNVDDVAVAIDGAVQDGFAQVFQDIGSAHPTTWYKSFTDDVRTGRPVTFDTLFAADTTPLDAIFPIVRNTLEVETGLTVSAGDGRDPSRYQNFAVTDDAVIFFFGQAELLPSFAGTTSVSLPRNVIPPLAL
jgi:hypothetical protein